MPNVKFFFNHKLVGADFRKKVAWFEKREISHGGNAINSTQDDSTKKIKESEVTFDFMIGADGAHSAVRYHLMKYARMSYQQDYIDTLWCEFHISPKVGTQADEFKISPNHLHIWPGGQFMFIAIPSLDKSFTSTLFLPESRFKQLDAHPESLITFFEDNFPGVVPDLISEADIKKQYNENPHLPLISIKCNPYHYSSSVVILGDAAHAMVPFYGQGMNAGLEDVRVLYDHLDKRISPDLRKDSLNELRAQALSEYTDDRHPDASTINDLALRNYQEMRSDVRSPVYLLRKFVEERLYAYFPSLGWATQYSRVSFGNERYSEVERRAQKQSRILLATLGITAVSIMSWTGLWLSRTSHNVHPLGLITDAVRNLGRKLV
jgi:kynurenine 3-monooxygenase